jgi:hypothetical protein
MNVSGAVKRPVVLARPQLQAGQPAVLLHADDGGDGYAVQRGNFLPCVQEAITITRRLALTALAFLLGSFFSACGLPPVRGETVKVSGHLGSRYKDTQKAQR